MMAWRAAMLLFDGAIRSTSPGKRVFRDGATPRPWFGTTGSSGVVVARMGEKFEVLATNTLKNQTFLGTPAILDGEIYLRGQNTLFCIR